MLAGSQPSGARRRRLPGGRHILLLAALATSMLVSWVGLSIIGRDPRLLWYQYQAVDALHATRTRIFTAGRGGTLPSLDKTIADAHSAQALYNAAFALPPYTLFAHRSCVSESPIIYHLAFSRTGSAVATVDFDLADCMVVSLAGIATRYATPQFIQLVANTLGMTETTLLSPIAYPPYQMSVKIERVGETPTTRFTPLSRTITNTQAALALDNAVVQYSSSGGSPYPPPASACPPNDGVAYRLTFYGNGIQFAVKDVETTGCQLIYTHDGFPPVHISDPAFWRLLASDLGVPESSLAVGPPSAYWTTPPTVPAAR